MVEPVPFPEGYPGRMPSHGSEELPRELAEAPREPATVEPSPHVGPPGVILDSDGKPIIEVPLEMLKDIRRQLAETGHTKDLQELEATYDLDTGKMKVPLPKTPGSSAQ